jgi:flagellar hook-associated protein 2
LVTAFNDANTILKEVSDPKSSLDTFGATLVSDSTVRMISQQMRNMVLGTSSTPATKASGLWQIGVSITQTGELDFDETKIDLALKDNYDDVVKMFTGDKNLFLSTGTDPAGIAGDAVRKITTLLGTSGPLVNQTQTATTQNNKYKEDLTKLQTRMDSLLKRYTTQFASMQSLVGQTNSMKTSLKSSFEGMMSAYTNK